MNNKIIDWLRETKKKKTKHTHTQPNPHRTVLLIRSLPAFTEGDKVRLTRVAYRILLAACVKGARLIDNMVPRLC